MRGKHVHESTQQDNDYMIKLKIQEQMKRYE